MAARMAAAGGAARRECFVAETADGGTLRKIADARRLHEPARGQARSFEGSFKGSEPLIRPDQGDRKSVV